MKKANEPGSNTELKTGLAYLWIAVAVAAAAAVYSLFSHGVYSGFMTYAFMIPLIAGAVPHLTAALKGGPAKHRPYDNDLDANITGSDGSPKTNDDITAFDADGPGKTGAEKTGTEKLSFARDAQAAVIATLTAGSILKGVLDIYGTTNRLLISYPVLAVIILAAALVKTLNTKMKDSV